MRDDSDRQKRLHWLERTVGIYGWKLHTSVVMSKHDHLFLETPEPNLSEGMQYLNGSYSGYFNARHRRVGSRRAGIPGPLQGSIDRRSAPVPGDQQDARLDDVRSYPGFKSFWMLDALTPPCATWIGFGRSRSWGRSSRRSFVSLARLMPGPSDVGPTMRAEQSPRIGRGVVVGTRPHPLPRLWDTPIPAVSVMRCAGSMPGPRS